MVRKVPARSDRRLSSRRNTERRRRDVYYSVGRLAGLIGFPCAAILGQAELIGEPTRHYVTVIAIICTAIWAYGTKPDFMSTIRTVLRGKVDE